MRDGESNISILELRTLTVPGKSSQLKKNIYISMGGPKNPRDNENTSKKQ